MDYLLTVNYQWSKDYKKDYWKLWQLNEISIKIFPLSLITFIRQNCPSFNTNNLFYTFTFRIVICFIETTAKVGNYHKNPFDFRRKWTVTTSETQNIERNFSERELFLEQRLAEEVTQSHELSHLMHCCGHWRISDWF